MALHICFIGEYPHQGHPVGGISMFIRNTVQLLLQNGHRVTVLSFSESVSGWEQQEPFALYRIHPHKWRWFNFWRIAREQQRVLKAVHGQHAIDVVETPESGLCFLPKIAGIRYVIRLHGGHMFFAKALQMPMKSWPTLQEMLSFRKADAIIGVSQYVLAATKPYLPANVPTHVVHNGIDTQRFSPPKSNLSEAQKIVFVGWMVAKKGPQFLLAAFQQIAVIFPAVTLHFYGRDTKDASGHSFIEKLQATVLPAFRHRIFFHGNVPNELLPGIISEAYCCVYPSQMEAMPVAWLEVLACGQLLIAGNAGPAAEIIADGHTGLLCDPTHAESIAAQLSWALQHPSLAAAIREQARLVAVQKFDASNLLSFNLSIWAGDRTV